MRELLVQNGVAITERDYFKEPFTEPELRALIDETVPDAAVGALFASRSPSLKKQGLDAADLSDDRKLALMLAEPRLIRRPIIRLNTPMGRRLIIGANLKTVAAALSDAVSDAVSQ